MQTLCRLLLLSLLLTGCGHWPERDCRTVGVNVPNGAAVTGEIVFEHEASAETVAKRCQSPFRPTRGCAIAIGPSKYEIWHTDGYAAIHEKCHVLYEAGH